MRILVIQTMILMTLLGGIGGHGAGLHFGSICMHFIIQPIHANKRGKQTHTPRKHRRPELSTDLCMYFHSHYNTAPHEHCTYDTLTNSGLQDPPKKLAVCFWHNIVQSEELPYAQYMGLLSSEKAAFEAVHLLSYQRYVNVPRHVTWVDARAIMPHERFLQLYESGKVNFRVEIAPGKKGDAEHSSVVCLLSDFIRLKYAATIRLVNYSRVAVIDCDTIWLRKWDSEGVLGCEFASLCENASSFENFDKLKRRVKFLLKYATEPGDMGKIVPPFQFIPQSPVLATINDSIFRLCPDTGIFPPVRNWEIIMDSVLSAVNQHGLRGSIVAPNVFTPVPWYARQKPLAAGSVHPPYSACAYVFAYARRWQPLLNFCTPPKTIA